MIYIWVFHISVSWWSFTGVWVTTSLLKYTGLFSVFWPFTIMLLFGASPSDYFVSYYQGTQWGYLIPLQWCSLCILHPKPQDIRWGSNTPLHWCTRCILRPHPTGPQDTRWGAFCNDAIGVFYSLRRLGPMTLVGGVWPISSDVLGVFYCPSRLGHRAIVGGISPLFSDAVGVFYSPRWLGSRFGVERCWTTEVSKK